MKKSGIIIGLLCMWALSGHAQETTQSAEIEWYPQMIGGANLFYLGRVYGSNWGLDSTISERLRSRLDTQPLVDSYNTKLLSGYLLAVAGVGSFLLGGAVVNQNRDPTWVNLALEAAGAAAAVASPFLVRSAHDDLSNAVIAYNAGLPPPPQAPAVVAELPPADAPKPPRADAPKTETTVPEAAPETADETGPSLEDIMVIDQNLLGSTVYWHNMSFSPDEQTLTDAIAAVPSAKPLIDSFGTMRTASMVALVTGGVGVVITPVVLLFSIGSTLNHQYQSADGGLGVSEGIATASLAAFGASVLFHLIAENDFRKSVEAYNSSLR